VRRPFGSREAGNRRVEPVALLDVALRPALIGARGAIDPIVLAHSPFA
jgi:hypothetical protein